jgi:antitoxin component of MazEF toxin-antitoxin module
MAATTCKVDERSRVVLPGQFVGQTVEIEAVSESEVRIRVVRAKRRRPSLAELMAGVTDENQHPAVEFGPPVGNESL